MPSAASAAKAPLFANDCGRIRPASPRPTATPRGEAASSTPPAVAPRRPPPPSRRAAAPRERRRGRIMASASASAARGCRPREEGSATALDELHSKARVAGAGGWLSAIGQNLFCTRAVLATFIGHVVGVSVQAIFTEPATSSDAPLSAGKHLAVRYSLEGTVKSETVRAVSRRLIFFTLTTDDGTAHECLAKGRDRSLTDSEIELLASRLAGAVDGSIRVRITGFPEVAEEGGRSLHVIQAALLNDDPPTLIPQEARASRRSSCRLLSCRARRLETTSGQIMRTAIATSSAGYWRRLAANSYAAVRAFSTWPAVRAASRSNCPFATAFLALWSTRGR